MAKNVEKAHHVNVSCMRISLTDSHTQRVTCSDYRDALSEMKVEYVPPRHRHLPLQRMCRRQSRLTLHAGLITVSDSQTAPATLKMSLWNLCVCKLPIIPSIRKKIKGLMIC